MAIEAFYLEAGHAYACAHPLGAGIAMQIEMRTALIIWRPVCLTVIELVHTTAIGIVHDLICSWLCAYKQVQGQHLQSDPPAT